MGIFTSCCRPESDVSDTTPDRDTMRRIQAEAVDRRLRENETRGVKDPEYVKQQIARKHELERLEAQAGRNNARNDQIVSDWQS